MPLVRYFEILDVKVLSGSPWGLQVIFLIKIYQSIISTEMHLPLPSSPTLASDCEYDNSIKTTSLDWKTLPIRRLFLPESLKTLHGGIRSYRENKVSLISANHKCHLLGISAVTEKVSTAQRWHVIFYMQLWQRIKGRSVCNMERIFLPFPLWHC